MTPASHRTANRYDRIVILTGAGISAESGLGTFRDKGGLWTTVDLNEVATPQGYSRNPAKVHDFYNRRRRDAQNAVPNDAHKALARLQHEFPGDVWIVTQNVDDLHERAGSTRVIHMHGALASVFCTACDHHVACDHDLSVNSICAGCATKGTVRPDIVWFGEIPYHMDVIEDALSKADLFVSIGTSGNVYPAAGFVRAARYAGAHTVELNLEPSEGTESFAEHHHGPATRVVPQFVQTLLAAC